MTKVLVLGSRGMLGHQLVLGLSKKPHYQVYSEPYGYDAREYDQTQKIISQFQPEFIINAIGLINKGDSHLSDFIKVNALYPHQLSSYLAKVIQISTDCVFDGNTGNYSEQDKPNATDYYGITKIIGELNFYNCITIRTSFIGRELYTKRGLLEWLLSQNNNAVYGYKTHYFSGITTIEMVKVIDLLIQNWQPGLYHVAGPRISKYDLLLLLASHYKLKITITPTSLPRIDRSLNGAKFNKHYGYVAPSWEEMIDAL